MEGGDREDEGGLEGMLAYGQKYSAMSLLFNQFLIFGGKWMREWDYIGISERGGEVSLRFLKIFD